MFVILTISKRLFLNICFHVKPLFSIVARISLLEPQFEPTWLCIIWLSIGGLLLKHVWQKFESISWSHLPSVHECTLLGDACIFRLCCSWEIPFQRFSSISPFKSLIPYPIHLFVVKCCTKFTLHSYMMLSHTIWFLFSSPVLLEKILKGYHHVFTIS